MNDLPLTMFDLAVLGVVVLSALLALVRGATREALTIAAWLGAFVIAWYGFDDARVIAKQTIETAWLADIAAIAVVFLLPLIVLKALGSVVAEHVQGSRLGAFDRWLGVGFGVARGLLLVCLAYLGLALVVEPDRHPAWIKEAASLPYVRDGAALLRQLVPGTGEEATGVALGGDDGAPADR